VSGLLVLVFGGACPPTAQDDFYRGRTVRIVVGYSAGGGFDTYARAIARHLAKHIPGKPAVIVENMPGAADLVAANSIYRAGRPDGLTVVNFQGTQVMGQILGREGVEFDARKFEWLSAAPRRVPQDPERPGVRQRPAPGPARHRSDQRRRRHAAHR
jgi:tripartite-type tricarboxylate transporter receptor subunit TctC